MGFEELLRTSDVISVHVPLTSGTHHLISERELGLMKNSVILVNTSGGVIDERALVKFLKSGKIHAFETEVFEVEPPDPSSPLLTFENTVIKPHMAAFTGGHFTICR